MSQFEEGHRQWRVPHHIVGHSVLEEIDGWQKDCSGLPFLELHYVGLRPRGQIVQSWICFWGRLCLGNFLPERILCLEVTRKDELLNKSSVLVWWAEKKATLLLCTDLHKDKCNQLLIINLFIIQILETNLSLKPWGTENVLSKLSYEKERKDWETSWPIFYMILNPRKPQAIKGLSSSVLRETVETSKYWIGCD